MYLLLSSVFLEGDFVDDFDSVGLFGLQINALIAFGEPT